MKSCKNCNIDVSTSKDFCPLCQNKLTGDSSVTIFPENIRFKKNFLLLKILLFSSIVIFTISIFVEQILYSSFKFTFYLGLGLLTNFYIIYFILKNTKNVLKMFGKYGITLLFITLIWYLQTKNKFIPNYVIPTIALFELIFNFITGLVLRGNYFSRYFSIIFLNILLLIVPSILVAVGVTTDPLYSYICLGFAILTISGLTIFCFEQIKEELIKMFNL